MSRLSVRVTPRSSRDAVDGFDEAGLLRLRVTAAPAEGAANQAVVRLLSRVLEVPSRDVILVTGATSRQKVFEVPLTAPEMEARVQRWLEKPVRPS
ncbi:MAG TPA: DUF167 domain-containing protein [Tepidiformaceae bacterium]